MVSVACAAPAAFAVSVVFLAAAALLATVLVHRLPVLPPPGLLLASCLAALVLGMLARGLPVRPGRLGGAWRGLAQLCLGWAVGSAMALWAAGHAASLLHTTQLFNGLSRPLPSSAAAAETAAPSTRAAALPWSVELQGLATRSEAPAMPARWRIEGLARSSSIPSGARVWVFLPGSLPEPLSGQRITGMAVPQPIHGLRNLYGFDFETWAFEKGLVGRLAFKSINTHDEPSSLGLYHAIHRARSVARQTIVEAMPQSPHLGVMLGLTLGDQAAISQEDWALFSATGISHLVSISGSHITVFAWLAQGAVALAWGLLARLGMPLALWLPTPVVSAVVGCLAAWSYALFAGFGLPAQRTAAMVMAVSLSRGLAWPSNGWGALALGALGILLWQPSSVLAPGFWLSFVAVAILFGRVLPANPAQHARPGASIASAWITKARNALHGAADAQGAITFGLAAWTILFFSQVSLVGPAVNALAIPWVGLVVTPLALLGTACLLLLGLGGPLQLAHDLWEPLHQGVAWAASLPWAQAVVGAPSAWVAVPALLGPLLALRSSLPGWRRWGWLGVAPLLLNAVAPWQGSGFFGLPGPGLGPVRHGEFQLEIYDVGQGSAISIHTAKHHMLLDAGPMGSGRSIAEQAILPALRARGIRQLDAFMASHGDADHTGGMEPMLLQLQPAQRLGNLRSAHPQAMHFTRCVAGLGWVWDGVRFDVLGPPPSARPWMPGSNADSCSLRVRAANGDDFWNLGDMPSIQEWALLYEPEARLAMESPEAQASEAQTHQSSLQRASQRVLMAVHHGSRSSNSLALLQALRPSHWVSQSAHGGRFGHPHPEAESRARSVGAEVLRTDLLGGLVLHLGAEPSLRVHAHFDALRRFWHPHRAAQPRHYTQTHEHPLPTSPSKP